MTIWRTLGIAADSDRDAIRRAYARKLRQTNPEDDPEGFMRLREAYDTALRYADFREQQGGPGEAEADPSTERPEAPAAKGAEPAEGAHDQPSDEQLEMQAHATAILAALQSPEPERWQDALAPLQALLASAAMEQLELRRSVENWLAHQIASHAPQSDVLIDSTIEYFGWDQVGFRHVSTAIEAVLRRQAERTLAGQLQHPQHALHRAWIRLRQPKPSKWMLWLQALMPGDRQQIRALLLQMQVYPGLSFYLEAGTVDWWRTYLSRPHLIDAFAFTPVAWLFCFVMLTSARGQLVPVSSDAALAIPFALAAAVAYWWITRRALNRAERPQLAAFADRAWMMGLPLMPLLAMFWTPAPIAIFMALVLALQDFALAQRPPSMAQRFNVAAYLTPVGAALLISGVITEPFALAWFSVLAGLAVGWHRGQYRLPVQLLAVPLAARRLAFPALFMVLVGVAWATLPPPGPARAYRTGLTVLLCGPLIRVMRLIEPAGLYRQILLPLASFLLVVFWFAAIPDEHQVATQRPPPPVAGQPIPADAVSLPPAMDQPRPAPEVVCPRPKSKRRHPGAVGPQLCGTLSQWFSATDYPPEALDHHKQGMTKVAADIGLDGRAHRCRTIKSSGDASLDETTCRVIEEVGRFLPARDEEGRPRTSKFTAELDWRLHQ